jgi:hypothetical protein
MWRKESLSKESKRGVLSSQINVQFKGNEVDVKSTKKKLKISRLTILTVNLE